jgi:hypothetical protein
MYSTYILSAVSIRKPTAPTFQAAAGEAGTRRPLDGSRPPFQGFSAPLPPPPTPLPKRKKYDASGEDTGKATQNICADQIFYLYIP